MVTSPLTSSTEFFISPPTYKNRAFMLSCDRSERCGRHLSALGRFGETAFIAPLYGVGELPQSFCRMAAVHGAVYVLRRQLKGAMVDRVTGRSGRLFFFLGGWGRENGRDTACVFCFLSSMLVCVGGALRVLCVCVCVYFILAMDDSWGLSPVKPPVTSPVMLQTQRTNACRSQLALSSLSGPRVSFLFLFFTCWLTVPAPLLLCRCSEE